MVKPALGFTPAGELGVFGEQEAGAGDAVRTGSRSPGPSDAEHGPVNRSVRSSVRRTALRPVNQV